MASSAPRDESPVDIGHVLPRQGEVVVEDPSYLVVPGERQLEAAGALPSAPYPVQDDVGQPAGLDHLRVVVAADLVAKREILGLEARSS